MSQYSTVERSAQVPATPADIIPWLVDLRRWVQWSPWEGLDPALKRTYSGADSGVGAVYEWSGNRKAGAGRMEITSVTNSTVVVDLRFTKPFKSTNTVTFVLNPAAAGTHLVWRMRSTLTPTMRVFGLVMKMDKMIGGDLEKGLTSLGRVATTGQSELHNGPEEEGAPPQTGDAVAGR
jgi:hypothetical protein